MGRREERRESCIYSCIGNTFLIFYFLTIFVLSIYEILLKKLLFGKDLTLFRIPYPRDFVMLVQTFIIL